LKKDPSRSNNQKLNNPGFDSTDYDRLLKFQSKLAHWNRRISLTSIPDKDMLERLILPSAWLGVRYSEVDLGVIADFGTGAGIPGIPMAIIDSRNKYLLVDANAKKSAFVKACVADREINIHGNIEMRTIRVEEGEWAEKVNGVVTRGAGTMLETSRLWERKLNPPAFLDFFKGERADQEIENLLTHYSAAQFERIEVPVWFGNLKLIRIKGVMA